MESREASQWAAWVLRSLLNRLRNQAIFSAEYDQHTKIVGYKVAPPLDYADFFTEEQLQKAADAILLQIRENSYETFVVLPVPQACDLTHQAIDPDTKFSVRFVRSFDIIEGNMLCRFDIGVRA